MATPTERAAWAIACLMEYWPKAQPVVVGNPCILAVRTGIEVGRQLGVSFEAIPVDVAVLNERAVACFDAGKPPAEWDPWAFSIGAVCKEQVDRASGGWEGHLILGTHDWLADLTAGQFARPDKRLLIGAWAFPRPPATFAEWWWSGDMDNSRLRVVPRKGITAYRRTPAWQQDYRPVADQIVKAIVAEAEASGMVLP